MNFGPFIFLGVLLTLSLSWLGMIVTPYFQLGDQRQETVSPANYLYPSVRPGQARQGAEVYRANGCYYCHTREVLPESLGADLKRGWGVRVTVAQDFLYDQPPLVGNQRIGPDLANIGLRQTNEVWHLLHLYNPRITSPGSIMPSYPYLFEKRKAGQTPSAEALKLPEGFTESGFEIVPKPEAYALVAYLQSQAVTAELFEAPLPRKKKPAEGSTNEPPAEASATNQTPAAKAETK